MSRLVFMFAGQGAQYFQMGRSLYERERVFRQWMMRLDAVAQEASGRSVVAALYDPSRRKSDVFQDLSATHPALFMVQYALARTLMERGIVPDALLGASLGTFVAAAVGGCMSPEEAVRAVLDHAATVQEHCEAGGMIAVLADPGTFQTLELDRYGELASRNFESHFVVSAPAAALARIEAMLNERQILFQRLPVAFAFHSRWVDRAGEPLRARFGDLYLKPSTVPMVCSVRAEWLPAVSADYFWEMTRRPIAFESTVQWLEASGPNTYLDVSPTGTLAAFARKVISAGARSRVLAAVSPYGEELQSLRAVVQELAPDFRSGHARGVVS